MGAWPTFGKVTAKRFSEAAGRSKRGLGVSYGGEGDGGEGDGGEGDGGEGEGGEARSRAPDVRRFSLPRCKYSHCAFICVYRVPCFITEHNSIAPVRGPPHLMALEMMIHI